MIEGQRLHEILRRQARPAPEQMVQFIRGHAGGLCDRFDRRLRRQRSEMKAMCATNGIIIAQRCVLRAGLCGAMVIESKAFIMTLNRRWRWTREPPDSRQRNHVTGL